MWSFFIALYRFISPSGTHNCVARTLLQIFITETFAVRPEADRNCIDRNLELSSCSQRIKARSSLYSLLMEKIYRFWVSPPWFPIFPWIFHWFVNNTVAWKRVTIILPLNFWVALGIVRWLWLYFYLTHTTT